MTDTAMRTAKVFDGTDANGRPTLNRPPLHAQEIPWIIAYLEQGPTVLMAHSTDTDAYDAGAQDVPLTYSTDGTWIWPGAVTYYLRKYGISPDPELVDQIRSRRFQLEAVSQAAQDQAAAEAKQHVAAAAAPPAPAPSPQPAPDAGGAERDLEVARAAAREMSIDPARFRVDGQADGALSMVRVGDLWHVIHPKGGRDETRVFGDSEVAATYFAGYLYLHRNELARAGGESRPEPVSAPRPTPAPAPAQRQPEPAQWPFQPLPGEPPLSLFRDRSLGELAPGTEVDHVGDSGGNLTYDAGTEWPRRSLPPDWQQRPYRVYRVERPLQMIRGTAIPWFNQPGGGTAYVLPRAIADLVAEGSLVEISRPTNPPY